jgi:hypothetical protein
LRQKLQQVLKLSKEKWEEARDHAMRAVVADNRMRIWCVGSHSGQQLAGRVWNEGAIHIAAQARSACWLGSSSSSRQSTWETPSRQALSMQAQLSSLRQCSSPNMPTAHVSLAFFLPFIPLPPTPLFVNAGMPTRPTWTWACCSPAAWVMWTWTDPWVRCAALFFASAVLVVPCWPVSGSAMSCLTVDWRAVCSERV